MIFVTVGTQLPFPRLIDAIEEYAEQTSEAVVAQTGPESKDRDHLDVRASVPPQEFDRLFSSARVIVAHAGIGTILSAKRFRRPLILMPRRADLGEHRNDHQSATARAVVDLPGIYVANEATDLPALLARDDLKSAGAEAGPTRDALIAGLAEFIRGSGR